MDIRELNRTLAAQQAAEDERHKVVTFIVGVADRMDTRDLRSAQVAGALRTIAAHIEAGEHITEDDDG